MPQPTAMTTPAGWTAAELAADGRWTFHLGAAERQGLLDAIRQAHEPSKPLFAYGRGDIDLGAAAAPIAAASREVRDGRGVALVRGLPRAGMSEDEFQLLTWAIGLHFGVARPQGKATQYIAAVRDAGTDYRSATGRGYSSNAGLDFHVDGADVVALTCYNAARSGGMSMCTSSVALHQRIAAERPDLLPLFYEPFAYSRQGEQAPDEGAFLRCPLYGVEQGRLFGRLNRNRVTRALDLVEEIVRRPELMVSMWLGEGDMQLINNHVVLHSRTGFEDHPEPERKRLLFRLWLATPDSHPLPPAWQEAYKSVAPGSVRGGIQGLAHDEACRGFERRQAADLGMQAAP